MATARTKVQMRYQQVRHCGKTLIAARPHSQSVAVLLAARIHMLFGALVLYRHAPTCYAMLTLNRFALMADIDLYRWQQESVPHSGT